MNPQASQMDNDVINLAKAIRQTESGGDFNAKGASGESGAYQWTPDTWKAHAGNVLGNANAEMTPSNQNAVAYKMLKTWKDAGLNPAQIAAKWNSGSEVGWENKRGTNSYGVQYDVPRYVKSVTDAYQKVKSGSQVGIDQNNPSAVPMMAQPQGPVQPEPKGDGFLKTMAKSIVSPVATMLARPFQAGAELMGASADTVDKYTKGNFGDWVAPVPRNFGDVKKDVGRGIQTAAFGLGPVSGGAAFGTGMSLERGNDLASWDTLAYTAGGAAFGKAADILGKPLLNATGQVVGKITPEVLKTVAMGGAKAVERFMAQNKILPNVVSKGINRGAEGLERGLNAPFNAVGRGVKAPFVQNDGKVITARERALQDLEEKYAQLRANAARDPNGTAASRARVAKSNVLTEEGMINEDGVIIGASRASDAYEAEAIGQGNRVVRQLLDREGVAIDIETQLRAELERVARETFDGAELTRALKNVEKELSGLRIKRPNGRITLTDVHGNKISTRPKGKDYDDPLKSKMKKSISRGYKEAVEKYSKENIGEINAELQKFYDDSEYIANLQGKRIESGKLGKAVARVGGALSGAVIGGALGGLPGVAAGSYVGGVVSSKLAGRSLSKAFGKPTKLVPPKSKVIGEAVTRANAPRNQLALPAPKGKTPIPLQPPKGKPSVGGVKAQSYVDRDKKTGKFRKVYLSGDKPAIDTIDEKGAVIFASPNVKEDLNFGQAKTALLSDEHKAMVTQYKTILSEDGMNAKVDDAIGDWADGAENTTVTTIKGDVSYEQVRATAARMGLVSDQKAVIPFKRDSAGKDTVYEAVIKGKNVDEIRATLDELGLQFRTLVTKGDTTKVIVFDSGSELAQNVTKLSHKYGIQIRATKGKGEFLGGNTREEGASAYREAIGGNSGRNGRGGVGRTDNRNVNAKTNLPNLNKGEILGAGSKGGVGGGEVGGEELLGKIQFSIPSSIKKEIKPQRFVYKKVLVDDLIENDPDLADFVAANKGKARGEQKNPVIVGKWQGRENSVMDGWHRIAKLKNAGVKEVDAYVAIGGKGELDPKNFKTAEEFVSRKKSSIVSADAEDRFIDTFRSGAEKGSLNEGLSGDIWKNAYFKEDVIPHSAKFKSDEFVDPSRVNYWKGKIKSGDRTPVLIDVADGVESVVDGNHKLQAYKQLKIDVPVIKRYENGTLIDIWKKATGKGGPVKASEIVKSEKVSYKQFGKQLRKQIERDLLGNKDKAVIIDSDTIKKAHPDYDPNNPKILHEESSSLSKELLQKAIDEDTTGIFRMTGGGAGSGKSEAVLKRIKSRPSVIFDGVLGNPGSAIEKIDYALSKGMKVEVYPVYAPIELATLFNKLRSRSVPDAELVAGHYGFRDTIPQLIAKYGNKIKVKPYENVGFGVKPRKLSQKRWEAKEIADNQKMTKAEAEKANADINRLIELHGLDWTKENINGILKAKYGQRN